MKRLLRIGDMARLAGVSVKALRFYEEQGLISPEHVDPQTGYRHYTPAQAETLAIITNLRAIDFSIAEIGSLLAHNADKADAIQKAIATKQAALAAEQNALADKIEIASILAALVGDGATTPFRLAPLADEPVHAVKTRVTRLGAPVTEIFETAEADVAARQARADRPPFMIFHDPPTRRSDLSIEVCIPVEDAAPDLTIIPGAALALSAAYAGGYETTNRLFADMSSRIADAGLSAAGPLREVYHRFGADQDDYSLPPKVLARARSEFVTELQIPISTELL